MRSLHAEAPEFFNQFEGPYSEIANLVCLVLLGG